MMAYPNNAKQPRMLLKQQGHTDRPGPRSAGLEQHHQEHHQRLQQGPAGQLPQQLPQPQQPFPPMGDLLSLQYAAKMGDYNAQVALMWWSQIVQQQHIMQQQQQLSQPAAMQQTNELYLRNRSSTLKSQSGVPDLIRKEGMVPPLVPAGLRASFPMTMNTNRIGAPQLLQTRPNISVAQIQTLRGQSCEPLSQVYQPKLHPAVQKDNNNARTSPEQEITRATEGSTGNPSQSSYSSQPPSPLPPPLLALTDAAAMIEAERMPQKKKRRRRRNVGKSFPCPTCNKVFTCSSNLKRHTSVHTGRRPYLCEHCGRAFSNSSNRRKHEKTHLRSWSRSTKVTTTTVMGSDVGPPLLSHDIAQAARDAAKSVTNEKTEGRTAVSVSVTTTTTTTTKIKPKQHPSIFTLKPSHFHEANKVNEDIEANKNSPSLSTKVEVVSVDGVTDGRDDSPLH